MGNGENAERFRETWKLGAIQASWGTSLPDRDCLSPDPAGLSHVSMGE